DIGILRAAVEGLSTSPERKAALLRHLWRPKRFRKLLAWFTGDAPRARTARTSSAPFLGLRSQEEVHARLELLDADAKMPPIPAEETAKIAAILSLKAPMAEAADRLGDTLGDVPSLQRMRARIAAMEALGIDVTALEFEGAYGRTNMEYYDGFVFGFYAAEAPLPPVATGGRYDALTAAMGRAVPAVGGVIRPALFVEVAS
ncbi:MAG: ATP phosphoribosyltransferase regulatory subunit, partial [Pseudomonadota bacterium]